MDPRMPNDWQPAYHRSSVSGSAPSPPASSSSSRNTASYPLNYPMMARHRVGQAPSSLNQQQLYESSSVANSEASTSASASASGLASPFTAAARPSHPAPYDSSVPQPGERRKRAKPTGKITRNRKITSCMPCRERKQKCDRNHPQCHKCIEDGRKCVYVDHLTGSSQSPEQRQTRLPSTSLPPPAPFSDRSPPSMDQANVAAAASYSTTEFTSPTNISPTSLQQRRRAMVAATYRAGRDRSSTFEQRVKAARAAAVAQVLFETSKLKLPTAQQAEPLLDYFKRDVQSFCNIVNIDLNRARVGSFLDWWHSSPLTMPPDADAPLAPLVLVVLALSLQAKRTREAFGRGKGEPFFTHNEEVLPCISSERVLLETSGALINSLQIACPSSWATAYAAPIDVIIAETLRALWHLGECHLQFASSTLSVALRLCYGAGLHRDPKHWHSVKMGDFEAQARRNVWWNCVSLEVSHSHRMGQPSCIGAADLADTELPLNFSAVTEQYESIHSSHEAPTQTNFECMLARFNLSRLFLQQSSSVFGLQLGPKKIVGGLDEVYTVWRKCLTDHLGRKVDNPKLHEPSATDPQEGPWDIFMLQINYLQGRISIHRPRADLSTGCAATEKEATESLHHCLEAASRLVSLCKAAVTAPTAPPFVLLNIISYHTFNSGCMLAIQFVSGSSLSSLCRPAYEDALAVLDLLAEARCLCNVSEQAERYAAAMREIATSIPRRTLTGRNRSATVGPPSRNGSGHNTPTGRNSKLMTDGSRDDDPNGPGPPVAADTGAAGHSKGLENMWASSTSAAPPGLRPDDEADASVEDPHPIAVGLFQDSSPRTPSPKTGASAFAKAADPKVVKPPGAVGLTDRTVPGSQATHLDALGEFCPDPTTGGQRDPRQQQQRVSTQDASGRGSSGAAIEFSAPRPNGNGSGWNEGWTFGVDGVLCSDRGGTGPMTLWHPMGLAPTPVSSLSPTPKGQWGSQLGEAMSGAGNRYDTGHSMGENDSDSAMMPPSSRASHTSVLSIPRLFNPALPSAGALSQLSYQQQQQHQDAAANSEMTGDGEYGPSHYQQQQQQEVADIAARSSSSSASRHQQQQQHSHHGPQSSSMGSTSSSSGPPPLPSASVFARPQSQQQRLQTQSGQGPTASASSSSIQGGPQQQLDVPRIAVQANSSSEDGSSGKEMPMNSGQVDWQQWEAFIARVLQGE